MTKAQRAETQGHLPLWGLVSGLLKADSISCGRDFLSLVFLSAYFCLLSLPLCPSVCLNVHFPMWITNTSFPAHWLLFVSEIVLQLAGGHFTVIKKFSSKLLKYCFAVFECLMKDKNIKTQQDTTGRRKLSSPHGLPLTLFISASLFSLCLLLVHSILSCEGLFVQSFSRCQNIRWSRLKVFEALGL